MRQQSVTVSPRDKSRRGLWKQQEPVAPGETGISVLRNKSHRIGSAVALPAGGTAMLDRLIKVQGTSPAASPPLSFPLPSARFIALIGLRGQKRLATDLSQCGRRMPKHPPPHSQAMGARQRPTTLSCTRATPWPCMPRTPAAPLDRSMTRPPTKGPRSLMRTTTERPLPKWVTRTSVPNGSER